MLSNAAVGLLTALFSLGIYVGLILAGYFARTLLN